MTYSAVNVEECLRDVSIIIYTAGLETAEKTHIDHTLTEYHGTIEILRESEPPGWIEV